MSRGQPHWMPILDVGNPQERKWIKIQYHKYFHTIWSWPLPFYSYSGEWDFEIIKRESPIWRPGMYRYFPPDWLSEAGEKAEEEGAWMIVKPNFPPFPYKRKSAKENLEFWEEWLYFYWLNQSLGLSVYIGDYHRHDQSKNIMFSISHLTETSKITINRWFARIKQNIAEYDF